MTENPRTDDASLTGPKDHPSLLFGRVLNGKGGAREIGWDEARTWSASEDEPCLWLHLDRTGPDVLTWLRNELNLSDTTSSVLVSNETRPRAFREDDALIAIVRGLNFNEGAEPEDMIAMQVWANETKVLTLRRRRLQTPRDVLQTLDEGRGPLGPGDLVAEIVEQMVMKMNRAIVSMNERIDELEETAHDLETDQVLDEIAGIRRSCLALKRFMSPQHEALIEIGRAAPPWMTASNLRDIRETVDRLRRYLDDLDVSKESAIVLQDDLNNRAAAESGKTMYMLSIVAAIFLPLSFVTGLLGINVGGMPGVESPFAFWITVALMLALLGVQLWIFRKLKWL